MAARMVLAQEPIQAHGAHVRKALEPEMLLLPSQGNHQSRRPIVIVMAMADTTTADQVQRNTFIYDHGLREHRQLKFLLVAISNHKEARITRDLTKASPLREQTEVSQKGLNSKRTPSQAGLVQAMIMITLEMSSVPESSSSSEDSHDGDDRDIVDRDVLRGLHIAASAACDEEVDAFVRNRTGLRVRRFLADLRVLETLRDIQPVEDRGPGARRKRSTLRQLKQQVRRSREMRESRMAAR
ncbi:hypothetical protein V8C35DRAFT_277383 [Trichoderma chlorosporum]